MAASGEDENKAVRHRKYDTNSSGDNEQNEYVEQIKKKSGGEETEGRVKAGPAEIGPNTYWLTRIVFLRSIAFIYLVAFLIALNQNKQLLGANGLLPTKVYLERIKNHVGNEINWKAINYAPTLLWLVDWAEMDFWLDVLAYAGIILSTIVLLCGCANMFIMAALWVLYHSIVNIGQRWYSFGWESQLLETGFLAIFMCPLLSLRQFPRKTPTPWVALWGYRWLIFRIMLGAGLIKIRGDQCWRDLTCMNYHYETQPVPNPLSYYMHQSPELFHKFETLSNHFIELVAPFLILAPFRPLRVVGGYLQIIFQIVLIISGNLSFLNWLTILPSIACLDDKSLAWMFPQVISRAKDTVKHIQREDRLGLGPPPTSGVYIRKAMNISLGLLIAYLSVPVVTNLMSSRQAMNTSFESLRLVNTYGAFGSITKERTEVIFMGTLSDDPNDPEAEWLEYEFKCKPGSITRRPCLISPYHYRLDWLMWFAAFQNFRMNNWIIHLAGKLLINDEATATLIAHNPFEDTDPPNYIKMEHYRYKYTKIGSKQAAAGAWWTRQHIGTYMPPQSLDTLYEFMATQSWDLPKHIKRKIKVGARKKPKKRPRPPPVKSKKT
ncbi:lipase maturation factor 1-like [Amphiura filiformis]|uniref:lipase maturation factor 1-like n=1 Tax=Amphiura filiformis TaxID=82378 RepID=UPI003B2114C3